MENTQRNLSENSTEQTNLSNKILVQAIDNGTQFSNTEDTSGTVNTEYTNTENTSTENTHTENTHTESSGTESSATTKRMLYRHPQDRLIGGVCGGIAEMVGMDANLVRILWVVATLATGGGGILAYLALWMLLPVGTAAEGQLRPPAFALNGLNMGRTAVVLMIIGGVWFLANIGVLPWLWDGFWGMMNLVFWPALLIGIGYLLLNYSGREFKFNWDWRKTKDDVQNGVADRMPNKQSMKEGFNGFRQRFPLKRSSSDRIFMGVCGGIGQRIGIDTNLVRLIWAAFSVGSIGMGVLIYVLLGLFLPQEEVTTVQPYDEVQDVQVIDARTSHL